MHEYRRVRQLAGPFGRGHHERVGASSVYLTPEDVCLLNERPGHIYISAVVDCDTSRVVIVRPAYRIEPLHATRSPYPMLPHLHDSGGTIVQ